MSKLNHEDNTFGGMEFDRSSIDKRATLIGIRASSILSENAPLNNHNKTHSSMSDQSHIIDDEAS